MTERHAEMPDVNICLPVGFIEHLTATTSLDELLEVTATWLDSVVACDRSSLAILNEDEDSLELLAFGDKTIMPGQTSFGLNDSLVGKAFTRQRLINLENVSSDTSLVDLAMLWDLGIGSVLVAPLVSAGRAFGTINVGRYSGEPFSRLDELSLRSMASLLASYISVHRQIDSEQKAARVDHLTGLLNRRAILETLENAIADESDDPVSVLFLDLDGFKGINDAHGHATGDALLVEISRRLSHVLRDGDMIGRLGGDEFLAICKSGDAGEPAESIAKRLVRECSMPFSVGSTVITPHISVGVTAPHSSTQTTKDLLAEADVAMYRAKSSADSIAFVDDVVRAETEMLAAIDRDLVAAIENDEMSFFYQAIESLNSAELLGAEALLRWEHAEYGLIPPPLVLERVEASGLIERFTQWSLDKIGREWSQLQASVPSFATKAVSINLNPSQLGLAGYSQWHMQMLQTYGLRTIDIVVEIVESGSGDLNDAAEGTLRELGANGVILALDDFGASYNAISYFTRFPVHALKLDHSLIHQMIDNESVRKLVFGMAQISHELGLVVVAEGVERQAEIDLLLDMGIDHAQGRFLSPPMAVSEFTKAARRNEAYEFTLQLLGADYTPPGGRPKFKG